MERTSPATEEEQPGQGDSFQRSGVNETEESLSRLQKLIDDAYYRVGTYIVDDLRAKRSDHYVKAQIAKIEAWTEQLNRLIEKES